MIEARMWNDKGMAFFGDWLEHAKAGEVFPRDYLEREEYIAIFDGSMVDSHSLFRSRFDFGVALNEWFASVDFGKLISPVSDGLWAWLSAVYFSQLTEKGVRRKEHYIVTRSGAAGSLAYRHAVRTSYELVHIHGICAEICLNRPMNTFGDMTEQLASRQSLAHNRGFFQAAYSLYMREGVLRRGASSKPKKPADRQPGETTGMGSVRRLAIALQRLDLTHDTEEMSAEGMIKILPKEFQRYKKTA